VYIGNKSCIVNLLLCIYGLVFVSPFSVSNGDDIVIHNGLVRSRSSRMFLYQVA